jgi:hypothetical protein
MRDLAVPIDESDAGETRFLTLKRAAITGATAFVTVNIWTGCPLLAVWIGSRTVGKSTLSMGAVLVVLVVLAVLVFGMALLLTWLNGAYDELTGRQRVERRTTWLRSMRAEAERDAGRRVGVTPLEWIVMINVHLAVITLVAWYLFFAGAPAPTLCALHCY